MKTKNMTIPNWCGKFVSALAVLSVSMFGTSCNDEEFADSARKPLQLSVTANAPLVSRAIINDTYLPDGSQIGVTLTATDGSAYDNQDFYNLAYSASGTGAEQVWSSATPASLSTTSGKVIAYYPYNGSEELDLTAIPVETASQTDYMYAKPVTGIDFTSADINLNMQHAMTDIRINLKKGTYTGTGEVTKVTAKAAAFATSATMDAETGVFANVSGSGAQFVQEFTDLTLTTTVYSQDFLMVPDTKSTSGEVSILTIIDGKKFAVTVPYTESFQQGYSYVYNLTLDNSGLVLEGVDVTKWSVKVKEEQELEFYDNQYIVEIQVPSDNYTYKHNINGYDVVIDWGDGTTSYEKTYSSIDYPQHIFEKAGTYIVKSQGSIKSISTQRYSSSRIISQIIHIGKDLGVTNMDEAFKNHTLLKEIPLTINESLKFVKSFYHAFKGTNITSIPKNIFEYCTEATNFGGTFDNTDIYEIPEGLFDNCTKVTSFDGTDGISRYGVFSSCANLTTIPEGLFDKCTEVTNFTNAFLGCTNLTDIPEGLFQYNTNVTSFRETFYSCTSLTSIPERLFDNCTEVTSFYQTFSMCTEIKEIPNGLFDDCTKTQSFERTFYLCTSLTTIPEGLFDNCTAVVNFSSTFESTAIKEVPKGLFYHCTEVTNFYKTFAWCDDLTNIPSDMFGLCSKVNNLQQTFCYCKALQSIPAGLFDVCLENKNFSETFSNCTSLTSIPEGLFDKCTEVTSFNSTFSGCTGLTNIPEGLFDNCTEVTNFYGTFRRCAGLTEIPEGLFDNCTEVTRFGATFHECNGLTGESPYTVINVDGQDIKVHLYERANYPEYFTIPTDYQWCFYNCTGLTDYSSIPSSWLLE